MSKLLAVVAVFSLACGGSGTSSDPIEPGGGGGGGGGDDQPPAAADSGHMQIAAADMKWVPLDPKAGDKGPMVATLWGDWTTGPGAVLVKLPANFPGSPHIHTNDYRGVVVAGTFMNDKADAKSPTPMGAGSFWQEPGGRPHITACGAEDCIAFVEFPDGKFDFVPPDKPSASPGGWEAKNVTPDTLEWKPLRPDLGDKGPMMAPAWGDPMTGAAGFFIKAKAGFDSGAHSHSSTYHGIVIEGSLKNGAVGEATAMGPGSYWRQEAGGVHVTACETDCFAFAIFEGKFDGKPAE